MKKETGGFRDGVLPLSHAVICVCGNTHDEKPYINCNDDGLPFSIWESWSDGEFSRPEGFTEPPSTAYGFCVLCPECGRYYSEKEIELTNSAVVAGQVDTSIIDVSVLANQWYAHNEEFFQRNVDRKKMTSGQRPLSPKRPTAGKGMPRGPKLKISEIKTNLLSDS